jgi:hypothetical protein
MSASLAPPDTVELYVFPCLIPALISHRTPTNTFIQRRSPCACYDTGILIKLLIIPPQFLAFWSPLELDLVWGSSSPDL